MTISKKSYRYFALHISAIIATFRLDDFAKDSGKFACSLLDNIGADYILRQLNYCIDPTAIGYGAWLFAIIFIFGGGFFFFFDFD